VDGANGLRDPRVGIIGAGMSGIGMACKLRMAGIESFHVYERADDLGGTWHANTYPGLSCDVPSRYYQYTFAPNPDWTHVFSPGREIWEYIDGVARRFDVRRRISFNTAVVEGRWEDGRWVVRTDHGDFAEYDFLIAASGALVHTRKPAIPGLEDFAGASFHSAEWDHSVPLAGRRIAVIGTGSTGLQITRALAPVAARYELYQRTAQWIAPLANRRYTALGRALMRRFPRLNLWSYRAWQSAAEGSFGIAVVRPGWQRSLLSSLCRAHLRYGVRDPELRRRFTPPDQPMCKRLIGGTGFYKLFEQGAATLVDIPIDHIEADGIVTADGALHEQDVIVLATGFDAHKFLLPVELIGIDGERLTELWAREPFGYRTVALPGFPNVFMLIGPHSPFGNQSLFTISEVQADFAMRCIERWRRRSFDAMWPTRAATDEFNRELREAIPNTIWASGCRSWYLGADGTPSVWPWEPAHHREILQDPAPGHWVLEPNGASAATGTRLR
jgi:cation diffusion facilitator CzcD-associated flavoprotein CzcO